MVSYHVYFGELVIAQAVLALKCYFVLARVLERVKTDLSPEKRISTAQHSSAVIACSEDLIV